MGRINNLDITLESFLKQELIDCKEIKIMTGWVSAYGLGVIVSANHLSNILLITGNLYESMVKILDYIFDPGGSSSRPNDRDKNIIEALKTRRVKIWYDPKVHLKVFIITQQTKKPLVITGSSNLTYNGLRGKGEQCDFTRRKRTINMETQQFVRLQKESTLIEVDSWKFIRKQLNLNWANNQKQSVLQEKRFWDRKIKRTDEKNETEIKPLKSNLNPMYTCENFIFGESNKLVQKLVETVSKELGKYNPIFIYGGCGVGKTHLLHAIGNKLKENNSKLEVSYITSEEFTNDFLDSLKSRQIRGFEEKHKNLSCFLIDDIHFLVNKKRTQEVFFSIIKKIFDSNGQIVMSSLTLPQETVGLNESIVEFCMRGLIIEVVPPDLETRIAILRKKVENEKLYVPDDVITFIAEQIQTNIRQLEGALTSVVTSTSLLGTEISIDKAKEVLRDIITKREVAQLITIEKIQKVVAKHFHLNPKEMTSKKRTNTVAFPRQIAMYLARNLTKQSTTEIGEAFGGRDHTTVMHACSKIKSKISNDLYFDRQFNLIMQVIKKHHNYERP